MNPQENTKENTKTFFIYLANTPKINSKQDFQERIKEEIHRLARYNPEGSFSIVYLKPEYKKEISSEDTTPTRIHEIIKNNIRTSDYISFHKEKEIYTILLPETDKTGARIVASKLKEKIKGELEIKVNTGIEEIRLQNTNLIKKEKH